MTLGKDNIGRLPPPIGTSDWATFSRDSYCVDKTLLFKEICRFGVKTGGRSEDPADGGK